LPEAQIDEQMALLPGLDGRKMSKSYDNVIPLFEGGAEGLKDAVARIVTDSRLPGEPKEPEGAALVTIHDAFASDAERQAFRADLRAGLGWGDAKQRVVERIEAQIGPLRAEYERLMAHPEEIEATLRAGAQKARAIAIPLMARLRDAVGLRPMQALRKADAAAPPKPAALPLFKQYRESDGRFYFKLSAADGATLLQSEGFADAREAGAWVKRLKSEGSAVLAAAPIAWSASSPRADAEAALAAVAAAQA
jgi:tryptophanyl-tRNA synthetase